jgi:hypothetical protein
MSVRYRRPDKKNALSIINAAGEDMRFTLTLKPTDKSATTIVRNIYECFRMLGDAILVSKGVESTDHLAPLRELMNVRKVYTRRPLRVIDNLRRLRHNVNYYGYHPKMTEVEDAISIAKCCFVPLARRLLKDLKEQ